MMVLILKIVIKYFCITTLFKILVEGKTVGESRFGILVISTCNRAISLCYVYIYIIYNV